MRRRRTVPIGLADVARLSERCRGCVFWELGADPPDAGHPHRADGSVEAATGDGALEKEAWLSGVLLDGAAGGRLALLEQAVVGHVLWAQPSRVPRSTTFPTSPVGTDALLLTSLSVEPGHRGAGVGRLLVQAAAADAARSGVHALEAFGWVGTSRPCVLPAGFLAAVGFREVQQHRRIPRLRLDLASTLPLAAAVEARVDRWRTLLRPATRRGRSRAPVPVPHPVPAAVPVSGRHRCAAALSDDRSGRAREAGQPASSDSRIIPVGASASAGR